MGIDLGLESYLTLSDGRTIAAPHHLSRSLKVLRHRQRVLLRKKRKGTRRRFWALLKLGRAHVRVGNCRLDWIHKVTTSLVCENQVLVVEDLNVLGMVRNRTLARSISDAAWGEFYRQLGYKSAWHGRTFLRVGRFFPSTKRCSGCGFVLEELPLGVRRWTCPECGLSHDRDTNAAKNILHEGLRLKDVPPGGRNLMRAEEQESRDRTPVCPYETRIARERS